jgi:ABC-type branched-subunit amino acid transport system ATPase component/branched-subunit amino acid ABC-type transport system permease component
VERFLSLVISGGVSGAVYAILASGLVLTYSTSGVFNFAHGAVAFTTAFFFYQLNTGQHLGVLPSALISILVFAPLLGLLLDKVMFRGLARASVTARIVATVGLLIALPAIAQWAVERLNSFFHLGLPSGSDIANPPGLGPTPAKSWVLIHGANQVRLNSNELVIFVAAAASAALLWWVVRHTRLGLLMRAVVDRRQLAALRGTDPNRTSSVAWALGMFLAGLAGVVVAPTLGSMDNATFTALMFVAATATVLGGLRSIALAFAGGLLLGIIQDLVASYLNIANNVGGIKTATPFVLLFVGLFFLGRDTARRTGSVAEDVPPADYLADLSRWRRAAPWAVATVAFVVYTFAVATPYWRGLIIEGLCLALIFSSFVLVTGMGGMVSLAQAAFTTAAALVAGLLIAHHAPFVVAAAGGVGVAMVAGAVVALPALRLGGLPLALATLALALLGEGLVFPLDALNNSGQGWTIPAPVLGPINLSDGRTMAAVLIVLVGLVALLLRNLHHSASGRSILAVRSAEAAAVTSGISPTFIKMAIFSVSAGIAGLGGIMLATYNGQVTNTSTPVEIGLVWLAVTVLFGVRRPAGAVVAGLVYALTQPVLNYVTTSTLLPPILFGLGAIGLARNPDGILSEVASLTHRLRARRRARPTRPAVPAPRPAAPERAERLHAPVPAALVLEAVYAGYDEAEVLRGVDLSVAAGSVLALLGANGAGKSTTCSVAAGVLPPSAGRVVLDGRDVTGAPSVDRVRAGLLLAPESRGVFPSLTVEENLRIWLTSAPDRDEAYEKFPALAERRGLAAGYLSGGEQQMLTLAPLLVRPPRVLVADEPSLGLAPLVTEEVFRVLGELRHLGVSLLLVEEKAREVLDIADRVAFMELGQIVWEGPRSEVDAELLESAYLGTSAE